MGAKKSQHQDTKQYKICNRKQSFRYDWVRAILDNGWSIFYDNALFRFMNEPVMGTLIVTKDGKN